MKAVRRPRAIHTHTHLTGILVAMSAFALVAPATSAAATDTAATEPPAGDVAAMPLVDGRVSDRRSIAGDGIRVRGVVTHAGAGRTLVSLQVRRVGTRGWHRVASRRAQSGRKFTIVWRGGKIGRYLTRLTVRKDVRRTSDHLGPVYIFRRSFASWYGPGFYGRRTACGNTLTGSIVGVAHKTLPCGTRVTFYLRGRAVTASVIDRGPYVGGRDWDLAPALKRRLGFGSTGVVLSTS